MISGHATRDESTLHLDASDISLSALRQLDDTQVFKKPVAVPKKRPNVKGQEKKNVYLHPMLKGLCV